MLQYLVILLDDTSVSYCHYQTEGVQPRLMELDTLHRGICYAMMENLMIQFVYPNYDIPEPYRKAIETIDHTKIMPYPNAKADVVVLDKWELKETVDVPVVLRTSKQDFFVRFEELKCMLSKTPRLNVIVTDVETLSEDEFEKYRLVLDEVSTYLEEMYTADCSPQLNLLTDRIMLKTMNNCGAGDTSITLAPNGKFYVCPGFYYDSVKADNPNAAYGLAGDLKNGMEIKNPQLYKLENAPICRHCDAWQCKRCIWLNRKTTLEVNTPGHEQCVAAHLERNQSRTLLKRLRNQDTFLRDAEEIKEIDYLDPFDKRNEWQ